MLTWLSMNLGTIIISLLLLLVVSVVVISLVRNKKKGKSSCGGNCGHCPMGASCHHGE